MYETIPEKTKIWLKEHADARNIPIENLYRCFIDCENEYRKSGLRKISEDPVNGVDEEEYYENIEFSVFYYILSYSGNMDLYVL